jgi:hypothetical protein
MLLQNKNPVKTKPVDNLKKIQGGNKGLGGECGIQPLATPDGVTKDMQ